MRTWAWLPGLAAFVRRQIDQELKDGRVRENREDIETAFKRLRELREAVENLEAVVRRVEGELEGIKQGMDGLGDSVSEVKRRLPPPPPPHPPED